MIWVICVHGCWKVLHFILPHKAWSVSAFYTDGAELITPRSSCGISVIRSTHQTVTHAMCCRQHTTYSESTLTEPAIQIRFRGLLTILFKLTATCSGRTTIFMRKFWSNVALGGNPWNWSNTRNKMQITKFKTVILIYYIYITLLWVHHGIFTRTER
jgi:hypothetical protein